jgi:hypothetical protein
MIRITLVTGAGKLERQKYDEGAAKAVTGALRALGFEEDRGASAIPECAGSFKMQHDTGKNLKTVVVFPRILAEGDGAATGLEGKLGAMGVNGSSTALLREGSPEHKIAMASSAVFERMVGSMCPSWSQKKACVAAIDDVRQRLQGVEQKLLHGTPLDDAEQAFYDAVSATSLDEKATKVKDLMHKQVDEGKVTADERLQLLTQVKERIQSLTEEIEAAEKGGKPKRVEALTANKGKAQDRKKKLEGIVAQPPHPLKNEAEIAKLRREVEPLLEVEDGAKGRLLTLKESQAIAKKDDILEAIHQLEVRVRADRVPKLAKARPAVALTPRRAAFCRCELGVEPRMVRDRRGLPGARRGVAARVGIEAEAGQEEGRGEAVRLERGALPAVREQVGHPVVGGQEKGRAQGGQAVERRRRLPGHDDG